MRSLSRAFLLSSALGALLFAGAPPALSVETSGSEHVIIQEDNVLRDDLYAVAVTVNVRGEIAGDLVAVAAEEVVVDGTVTGSILAIAPRVVVNGTVDGDLRVAAGSLLVGGDVAGDLVVASWNIGLRSASEITGDVLGWAWAMRALGVVGGDLDAGMRYLDLAGTVGNDVDVAVHSFSIVEPLEVGGDLGYRSENPAQGLDMVSVDGVVVEKSPLPPNIRVRALNLFGRFLAVVFLTIAALTVAWGWPERTVAAVEDTRRAPLRAWALGSLVVFSPLVLVGIAALIIALAPPTAGLPLVAVFIPLTVATAGLVAALSLVAGVPVVALLGAALLRRLELYRSVLLGSVLVGVLWFLPVLGWLLPLLVVPMGIGGWSMGWRSQPSADEGTPA